jgi:hypothetical protein
MAERIRKQDLAGSPSWYLTPLMVLPLMALPPLPAVASPDPLPASVRACAAVADVLQRLACYDREVARYPAPKATGKHDTATSSSTNTPAADPTATAATSAAIQPSAAVNTPTAKAASQPAAGSQSVTAHVVSIDHSSDAMVLHLDNGQAWEELQSVSGDLSLREGDSVTIDKHFGSYWLTGPHVSSMRVRQKT